MPNKFQLKRWHLLLYLLSLMLLFAVAFLALHNNILKQRAAELQQEIEAQELQLQEGQQLLDEVIRQRDRNEELIQRMEEWLNTWEVEEKEITGYAPLDPDAIEGMCYAGDPNITASGAQVVPGVTAAAGPDVPLGTPVYVLGHGWRVVQDRGERIRSNQLDLAMNTQAEAFNWGRQKVLVIYPKEDGKKDGRE